MQRFIVQYGLGRDRMHTTSFSSKDAAVSCAMAMIRPDAGYLFSMVYDTSPKGEVTLVWDNRNGYIKEYEG